MQEAIDAGLQQFSNRARLRVRDDLDVVFVSFVDERAIHVWLQLGLPAVPVVDPDLDELDAFGAQLSGDFSRLRSRSADRRSWGDRWT
jgi:hypothetical protein